MTTFEDRPDDRSDDRSGDGFGDGSAERSGDCCGGGEHDGVFTEESITTDEFDRFTVGYASFNTYEAAAEFVGVKQRQQKLHDSVVWLEGFISRTRAALENARAELAAATDRAGELQRRDGFDPDDTERELLVTSLATSLHLSERSIKNGLEIAAENAEYFPNAGELWRAGKIHAQHMRALVGASSNMNVDDLPEFEERVLEQLYTADGRLWTPAQLRRVANRVKRQIQTEPSREQAIEAAADRGVWTAQQECGMTHVIIKTTPVLAEAAYDRLRQVFKLRDRRDIRTMGQFMSDAAMGLLVTGTTEANDAAVNKDANAVVYDEDHPKAGEPISDEGYAALIAAGRIPKSAAPSETGTGTDAALGVQIGAGIVAKVSITMPATLLARGRTRKGDPYAELAGGILIDDRTALQLAGGAKSWTRIFTHPVTGVAITADVYEPTASLRRLINARDQSCRFPGCNRPAHRTDQDHTIDWQYGGRTVPDNLACLCKQHHMLKHRLGPNHGWRVRQTKPGYLEWFGPGGEVHSIAPDPVPTWQPAPRVKYVHKEAPRADEPGQVTIPPEHIPKWEHDPRDRHPYLRLEPAELEPPDDGPQYPSDLLGEDGTPPLPF